MGHRKSHSRASKRETPEALSTHPKDHHDTNEGGNKACDKSRREKRECNRKKEHEDVSKKRHRERHKGKNRHHHSSKSTTREKPKDKASRLKDGRNSDNMSLDSDSSTSFLSSREVRHGRHSHSHSADVPRKRSRSCSADAHKEHRFKKSKENSEAFNMDNSRKTYEASNDPKPVEKDGIQRHVDTQLVQEKDSAEGAFSSELRTCRVSTQDDGCVTMISRYEEQEKGLDGKTDKVLEVELRQKALANFLRHQDTSCKMDEHMGRISPTSYVGTTQPASNTNEENEQVVTEVDTRWTTPILSNSFNVDASIDGHQWPFASDTVVSVDQKRPIEGSGLACDSRSNLEEGEISNDMLNENETGNEIVSSRVDEGKDLYAIERIEKEGPHAGRDICKEGHKSSLSSAGKVERAAESVNENLAAPSQAHAAEGALNVNPTTAQHDSSNAFEQKTMSVMRGGEMVQVNYKVYIPKRAAELARRRLHR